MCNENETIVGTKSTNVYRLAKRKAQSAKLKAEFGNQAATPIRLMVNWLVAGAAAISA